MRIYGTLAALSLAAVSSALTGVIPTGFDNVDANGTFALTSTAVGGRTYQYQINASQLTAFVNTNLNGLQVRLNGSVATDWPSATASFSSWDIYIGPGVDPSLRSSTFANNFTSSPTQVRSGALVFNTGSFSSVGSPVKPFGPTIGFNNYFYTGGHLTIEMRFAQQVGASAPSFDGATSSTAGYGTLFGASWAGSSTATTATGSFTANFLVTKLTASPVPEPATLAVLGIGAVAMLRRRKK